LSVVSNNLGRYKETVEFCSQALSIDEKAVKALYLRAQARAKISDFDEAITDIKEAIKLSPADKNLRDEFEQIKKQKQTYYGNQQK
jgi:tetratricopeptide (TPR) repeat protein